MSSLERLPSDETDDGNVRLTAQESETTKAYNPGQTYLVLTMSIEGANK